MRIVVALGGNALLRRNEPLTDHNQRTNIRHAARVLSELVDEGHTLVITHGNGPQVGLLALQASSIENSAFPLDVLDAESAGMIGYVIELEMRNRQPQRHFATLITQVTVDRKDPAFIKPTKPIGPVYDESAARRHSAERGWKIAPDGKGWRRVVPSPKPVSILEAPVIKGLIERNVIVICAGGGGIPVSELADGTLTGVEAVVDKDYSSALLASQIAADMLLLLTDVDAVYSGFGTPRQRALKTIAADTISSADFASGSMGPKVGAAIEFATSTRNPAAIGKMEEALGIVRGECGTRIMPSASSTA
ncbi:MAG: carbamate kinase [Flavobacteriaceae bacterium]